MHSTQTDTGTVIVVMQWLYNSLQNTYNKKKYKLEIEMTLILLIISVIVKQS